MIKKFYKYRNFSDPYMEGIIKNSSLYFSSVENFNDPFDCKLSFRQNYSKLEIKKCFLSIKERNPHQPRRIKDMMRQFGKNVNFVALQNKSTKKMIDSLGVLSLSANNSNILMWSHYSESHTGLVFEFEPKKPMDKKSCFSSLIKVDYSDHYEELSYINKHKEEIPKLLLTKYSDWAYEEEYRSFGLDFQGDKQFDKEELTSIFFGARATQNNIDKIKKLCNDYGFDHVVFRQAELNHGTFSLSFKNI